MIRIIRINRARNGGSRIFAVLLLLAGLTTPLLAYPLDGYQYTGIRRLLAYQLIQEGKIPGNFKLPPGALLPQNEIRLRLADINESFDIGPDTTRHPELQAGLERIFSQRDLSYRVALLDITDPTRPRYAAINAEQGYVPGSVGKLLVMVGLFNELRSRFPNSVKARAELLRKTPVVADHFIILDSHSVPVVDTETTAVTHRSIRVGDIFSLWEWVDHMVSPSSNAAASTVWKQALLLNAFSRAYPPSESQEEEFFKKTPPQELSSKSIQILENPLHAVELDTENLRLRTYSTRRASQIIPGKSSYATPRELLRWLIKLEQGKIVDRWSSLEMKKLLYFSRRRYRFAASPALKNSAVFFKSGSLYQCRTEPGYRCGQYRGNAMNLMHSVAIIESPTPQGGPPRVYLIAMMSNVLKVNSAQEHAEIASRIEHLIQSSNP
ncbi:serine hydrolase [Acidobacteria bacterium AH-259-O06]|nr:serine hydrolase [Acidobacteria bacterium AH-259-O06]